LKKKKRLSGIERRWFVNNVGVIMLLVAACVLGVVFSMAAYYDTNLRSGLENKAKTTTDFFSNYISQSYKEYYQSCIKFAQTFEEKDRLELQFISANGKLVASSYGKFAGRSPSTPEIQQAIDSQQIRHYKGRNPLTGERILAVSSPMIYTNGEVIGVLRYVTSLRNADLQILMIALIAVTVSKYGAAVLLPFIKVIAAVYIGCIIPDTFYIIESACLIRKDMNNYIIII
jgi:two-component system OmpR family sensor kinase